MVQKITCPKCGKEFAPEEGYKKHLEALEKKAVKDADKKNKADYENKLNQERKRDKEASEERLKAEQEKSEKFKKELLAQRAKAKEMIVEVEQKLEEGNATRALSLSEKINKMLES